MIPFSLSMGKIPMLSATDAFSFGFSRSCTKFVTGLATSHSLSAGVFIRSVADSIGIFPFIMQGVGYVLFAVFKHIQLLNIFNF